MTLSQRFGNIQLPVESSEDDCEPDDLEILNKLIGNRFKYSHPSALRLELGRSDTVHSDNDDDNDVLEMDVGWMTDFEASLKKSRENQNNSIIHKSSCLKISPVTQPVLNSKNDKIEKDILLCETDSKQKPDAKPNEIIETNKQKAAIGEVENLNTTDNTNSKPSAKIQDSSKSKNEISSKQSTSSLSKSKKDVKKPKVYNIEPALSFPLDDLLPSNNQKRKPNKSNSQKVKNRESEEETLSPSVTVNSAQTISSVSIESPQILSSISSQASSISGQTFGTMFQGTIYTDNENFDAHDDYNDVMLQCTGGVMSQDMDIGEPMWSSDNENSSMVPKDTTQSFINSIPGFNVTTQNYENPATSNDVSGPASDNCFLEAMQYSNKIAIEKIKAALNARLVQTRQDEIGSEFGAVRDDGSYGLYKAGNEVHVDKTPENKTEEELFQLLVQQIYALAETEEDKVKVESSLKEFQDEWRAKLLLSLSENNLEKELPSNQKEEANSQVENEHENEKQEGTPVDNRELFEGRTLLKGGVNPRHIPKTNIHKDETGRPKDPRNPVGKSTHVKMILPEFHGDFQREMRNKERKIPYNSKDPRCLRMVSGEPKSQSPSLLNDRGKVRNDKSDNKEDGHFELNNNTETDARNTVSQSGSGIDFNVVNNAASTYIGKSWDKEQQNLIQVIINQQSPSLHSNDEETNTEYRPSVLQSVNIVDNSDVDLGIVDLDIDNEDKHAVVKISDVPETEKVIFDKVNDYETGHVKCEKRNLGVVKTDKKDSERKNVFSRLGAKKMDTVAKREMEDLRNILNRGIEKTKDSLPDSSAKDLGTVAQESAKIKDKNENSVDKAERLERESRSRSKDSDDSNRDLKQFKRSSSISSTDSSYSDRRHRGSPSRVRDSRNKFRTTSSQESKFTNSNWHVTSREHNTCRNEANAIKFKLTKSSLDRFPSQHRQSNTNKNFDKNPRDPSAYYRSCTQNPREASVDRSHARNPKETSVDRSHARNPREASVDRSHARNPRETSVDRSRIQNPREASIDRSHARNPRDRNPKETSLDRSHARNPRDRNPKETSVNRSHAGNPREASVDRSHARNPREASGDGSLTGNPREASVDRTRSRNPREANGGRSRAVNPIEASVDKSHAQNPREASVDRSRAQNPREASGDRALQHRAANQSENNDIPPEGYQTQTKYENRRYRDPFCDGRIEQERREQNFRPPCDRNYQECLSDRGSVTLECRENDPPNKIQPPSSIKDRLVPWAKQKFDLRSTLSSKINRKRQHDHNTNIEEIEEKRTKNQTVICNVPDLRDKIKGSVNIDKVDKDKTVSDDEIQEEFKVKFTKSGSCVAEESGNLTGLFSVLGKHSLPRQPCNQRTAKALKQVEDDRKFLEEFKKKILSTSIKSSPNQSNSSLSSANMSTSSISDLSLSKSSTGGLLYTDMLSLAELKKK